MGGCVSFGIEEESGLLLILQYCVSSFFFLLLLSLLLLFGLSFVESPARYPFFLLYLIIIANILITRGQVNPGQLNDFIIYLSQP